DDTTLPPPTRPGQLPRQRPLEMQQEGDFAAEAERLEAERRAAQQVFEAKEMDQPHPRRPFYITLGVLFLCAAGYSGYLWWQLQPHYITNAAAVQQANAQSASASAAPASASAPPPAGNAPAPGQPGAPTQPEPAAVPAAPTPGSAAITA